MSSRLPATVDFSLEILAQHGGSQGPHRDGWGVAYYDQGDLRRMRDVSAASDSEWVRFLERQHLRSELVIAHIRKALAGAVALRNTQPFCRELGGRMHAFAHNGFFPRVKDSKRFQHRTYQPIGETDSEWAFCALLERMRSLWLGSAEPPSVAERFAIVRRFAWELRHLGMANFIYADGDTLFAHGHRRQHEGGEIRPPGLFTIRRECARGDGAEQSTGVTVTPAFDQHVVLIASVPLTDEPWRALGDGEILTVTAGDLVTFAADSAPDLAKPDRSPDS